MTLSLGRIVRYVMPDDSASAGGHRAAVVTRVLNAIDAPVHPGMCNLSLFLDGMADFQERTWRGSVIYDPHGRPGTWHWPTDPAAQFRGG